MATMTIRKLPEETKRGIQARAKAAGHSAEEEIRRILNDAILPPERVKIGSALASIGQRLGGIELAIERDKTPAQGVTFGS